MAEESRQGIVRFVPIGELVVYELSEEQINRLSECGSNSLSMALATLFLGVFGSFLSSLLASPPQNDRTFTIFVLITIVSAVTGGLLLIFGLRDFVKARNLLKEIKERGKRTADGTAQAGKGKLP